MRDITSKWLRVMGMWMAIIGGFGGVNEISLSKLSVEKIVGIVSIFVGMVIWTIGVTFRPRLKTRLEERLERI